MFSLFKNYWKKKHNQKISFIQANYYSSYNLSIKMLMDCTLAAVHGGIAVALKFALAELPNIELATFWLMFISLFFNNKICFLSVNTFCFLNIIFFGLADWSLFYFLIFNLYLLIVISLRRALLKTWYLFVLILGLMGYLFGSLYTIQAWLLYGRAYAYSYWINGFIFDFIHGTGNIILGSGLYIPCSKIMFRLSGRYPFLFNFFYLKNEKKKIKTK